MSTRKFETGAACLLHAGLVASWGRAPAETTSGRRGQPQITIFEAAAPDEHVYIPATSLTIYGTEALRALRAVIDEALLNEPNEESK